MLFSYSTTMTTWNQKVETLEEKAGKWQGSRALKLMRCTPMTDGFAMAHGRSNFILQLISD